MSNYNGSAYSPNCEIGGEEDQDKISMHSYQWRSKGTWEITNKGKSRKDSRSCKVDELHDVNHHQVSNRGTSYRGKVSWWDKMKENT